jgi:exodeoxyribonuclease III
MRISSWNVNGLRAVMQKGFVRWLAKSKPDIVGLQEVRAHPEQLTDELKKIKKLEHAKHVHVVAAERKGYSGVATISARAPDSVLTSLGAAEFDSEGRVLMARFGKLTVVSTYVPNGNGKERDNSRIPYKLAFQERLFDLLEKERRDGGRILVMGDINTALEDIDLARPKDNQKTSGFTPVERDALRGVLLRGWTDTFRAFEKGPGHYSWWSSRFGVREKNIGWRIDYVLASPGVLPYLKGAFIESKVKGSDHAPVGVEVDDAIVR